MKVLAAKVLALGGLCVLFAGVSNGAIAQGYEHRDMDHGHSRPMVSQAHRRLQKLHTVYAREINHGNTRGRGARTSQSQSESERA